MTVQQTSINAYMDLKHSFKNNQYGKILSVMERGKTYTNKELEVYTGIIISSITARVKELRTEPNVMLVYAGNRKCTITGKNVMSWRRL